LDPGVLGKRGVRFHAQAEDHQVRGHAGLVGDHRGHSVVVGVEAGHALAESQRHVEPAHRFDQHLPHVRVEGGHRGRSPVDQRDGDSARAHRLGDLQTDVAGADHHRSSGPVALQHPAHREPVLEGLHPEDPVRVDTGQIRADRSGAGGYHQPVEPLPGLGALVETAHPNRAPAGVDLGHLVTDAGVDRVVSGELLWGARDQRVDVGHHVTDEVRDATRRVGGVVAGLERDDLQLVGIA
jgi:hypothetical protein